MTDDVDKTAANSPSDDATAAATPESQETVAGLMADAPAGRDLEADALRAAEEAIARAELALASAELAGAAKDAAQATDEQALTPAKQRLIQVVIVLNVVLMGLVLALPNPPSPPLDGASTEAGSHGATSHDTPHGVGAEAHGPAPAGHGDDGAHGVGATDAAHGSPMDQRGGVSGAAWIRALELSGSGDYERAAQTLEAYLDQNPDLPAFERKTYYTALMHYLAEAGRDEEVEAYQGKLMALGNQRYLPADILRMARSAQDSGDGSRMRQLYSRFLLSQGRHTAAERKAVAEAYLALGDSYRLQAERGEQRASVMQRLREARLRSETRERRDASRQDGGQK